MARLARVAAIVAWVAVAARCGTTAPSCTYTVTPAVAIAPGGGSAAVNVSTGQSCSWTAESNASWVAVLVTLPTPRSGSGAAQIVAGPNTGAPRTGTVTIAGQIVTVTQAPLQTFSLTGRIREAWVDIGLSGVTVTGLGVAPAVTDRDGRFTIGGLIPGVYMVSLVRPSFQTKTQSVAVMSDATLSTGMLATITFPFTADDVTGSWAGGGPYPDEPFRLTLIRDGGALSGWYIDRRYSSDSVTGTYSGRTLVFRVPVADGVLTFECTVDDERHVHGLVKNERLGGNFPISMVR